MLLLHLAVVVWLVLLIVKSSSRCLVEDFSSIVSQGFRTDDAGAESKTPAIYSFGQAKQ